MVKSVSAKQLAELQKFPKNIRNICILAHVDHGKTTLADSLLASNGIISQKMAGKLRYLDSRKDEQQRGITMKSSAVAVHYENDGENYLINLIDSPGHVDFAGEVCTAVRLCDGAIIIVDVVEGVCPQTKVALQQAWTEHIHPLLVFNKMDRLILERKLTPLDAYAHLVQILEQVNAVMGELFASDILKHSESGAISKDADKIDETNVFNWSSGLDDSDDSNLYFSPKQGNVVFASALDGWGFRVSDFAKMYAVKLGANEDLLKRTIWGDFYYNSKTKQILKGAQAKAKKPLFVQVVLENIWLVYETICVQCDAMKAEKIIESLNLNIPPRDANHKDFKIRLQSVFGQWLPLANAILSMVCTFVPSPLELSEKKVKGLMCSSAHKFDILPEETKNLKSYFQACSSSTDAPVIVCVSKMVPVEKKMLPQNKSQPLTADEMALRREIARQQHAERLQRNEISKDKCSTLVEEGKIPETIVNPPLATNDTVFIAFARVYSGTVKRDQKLYVLGPKHDPGNVANLTYPIDEKLTVEELLPDQHITLATIKNLYLLMGKELIELDEVPAGNVLGIGGLEKHVLKSATLSSSVSCPSFIDHHMSTVPIVRVALEPAHPSDMPSLVHGMHLLNQADPCVQVLVQETGEHVLVSSGEVHLQRCIDDLKERFAKIDINVSAPIVSFRETIIVAPKMDMVNEAIQENITLKKPSYPSAEEEISHQKAKTLVDGNVSRVIYLQTPNKMSSIQMCAKPLPAEITQLLEENSGLLKLQDESFHSLCSGVSENMLTSESLHEIEKLKLKLHECFSRAGKDWENAVNQIWSFGPRRCGPNILLNKVLSYKRPSIWATKLSEICKESSLFDYDNTFISGFQLASLCGPLCDEPMMGVCFIVEDWIIEKEISVDSSVETGTAKCLDDISSNLSADISDTVSVSSSNPSSASSTPFGPFTGQIMSTVKEACKRAFQAQPQRLMAAMYSCNIQVTTHMLGKMYAVLGRRYGRVLHADMQEGSQMFHVTAELPVIESFDFANEIRKQTSGMALPQLVFSHWEVVDVDPFWIPHTKDEYEHFGEKADTENRARKYMNSVRRRKGLPTDEKIVERATKQRTITKNK